MANENGNKPTKRRSRKPKETPPTEEPLTILDEDEGDDGATQPPRLSQVEGDPGASYPSQGEPLGIIPGRGGDSAASELYEGDVEFAKWAVRGNRPEDTALAMVAVQAENDTLISPTYPVRGRYMHGVLTRDGAWHTLFEKRTKAEFSKMEFGIIAAVLGGLLLFLFLVGVVFSPGNV